MMLTSPPSISVCLSMSGLHLLPHNTWKHVDCGDWENRQAHSSELEKPLEMTSLNHGPTPLPLKAWEEQDPEGR